MAKIYPKETNFPTHEYMTSKAETFTIWMKSLVCHSNGCTVYDSNGKIVYRVDNYDRKCSREVHLMDLNGRVLYTIRKKSLVIGRWDGYGCINSDQIFKEKPYFRVTRHCNLLKGRVACQIQAGCDKYRIASLEGKAAFRIVDMDGPVVAEAKQKQTPLGVVLGDDVLTMEVKAGVDRSLVMAFVIVYGLMRGRM